jgi:hypothetical protein
MESEKCNQWSQNLEQGMHAACEDGMSVTAATNLTENQQSCHMRNNECDETGENPVEESDRLASHGYGKHGSV